MAPPKNQLLKYLAYNQEKMYFSIIADFFLTKSLLLISFLGRKCEILAKSHNSLRLHQPVKNPVSDNSNILWNS